MPMLSKCRAALLTGKDGTISSLLPPSSGRGGGGDIGVGLGRGGGHEGGPAQGLG